MLGSLSKELYEVTYSMVMELYNYTPSPLPSLKLSNKLIQQLVEIKNSFGRLKVLECYFSYWNMTSRYEWKAGDSDDDDEDDAYQSGVSPDGNVSPKLSNKVNFTQKLKYAATGFATSADTLFQSDQGTSENSKSGKVADRDLLISPQIIDSVGIFLDHIICHPFSMFRMQCQVNGLGRKFHLAPFSVMHVMCNQVINQGMGSMWKGLRGSLIFRGIARVSETGLSGVTQFPLEASSVHSMRQLAEHLALKVLSFSVVTPFYSSFVIETVQSSTASEGPGVLDGIVEAVKRIFEFRPNANRMLPVWKIALPMIIFSTAHYVLHFFVQTVIRYCIRYRIEADKSYYREKRWPSPYKPETEMLYSQLVPDILSNFVVGAALYPFQTSLNRLCVQGTRSIIDNTDVGLEVLPINTQYKGFRHCMATIINEESYFGLYRGFGAFFLQYSIQMLSFHALQNLADHAIELYFSKT